MTRAEAKQKIQDILAEATETESDVCYVTSVCADALELAIEALEQPEIIHCKDCDWNLGNARCGHNDDLWGEDDYCSHAERRK